MSYNGSGTFNINTAGQPVVTGTTITSTAFNLLTADLATGLTTALTKDGQTTPTANIPMGTFKITGLGAGSSATDAAQYGQLQIGATTIATVSGTDTLTGTLTPALAAYATGNKFSFIAVATNTGAATININSLGAKSITKQGSTALIAGDIVSGQIYLIEYDGTRFQLLNPSTTSANVSSISFGSTGLTPSTATTGAVTVAGTLAVANGGTGVTTSTGSGANALATSPTLVTPLLGTPTSGNLSNCTVDGTDSVGFRNIPQNAQTGSYTMVLADSGKHIYHASGAGAATYTIPAASSVAYPIGTAITFINLSATSISIAITTDTMYLSSAGTTGTRTLAQYGSATAIKVSGISSSGIWVISGSALT
jgi:hypothetical protein